MIELIEAIRISNDCSKKDAESILQDEVNDAIEYQSRCE